MEEIFSIEEYQPHETISSSIKDQGDQGHVHENNIDEITKWINDKFIENLNITMDDCVQTYGNNKSVFDRLMGGILIFLMLYVLYSILSTLYNFFDEFRTKRILRNLQNKKNTRKAE